MMADLQRIGVIARELGINPKTIRYYEEIGLIPEPARTPQGYRLYTREAVERIAFILRARALDFSLEDIGEILAFRERGQTPCTRVTELVAQRIQEIDAKIGALEQLRSDLEKLQTQSQNLPPQPAADDGCFCQLIEKQPAAVPKG
jgi:DNA-binding transcriptional MerR regulator